MTNNKKIAQEIINDYYYSLPNNGYLTGGINSCESRYKEAINCALISVKRIISTLELILLEDNHDCIIDKINLYNEVEYELHVIKKNSDKMTLSKLEQINKNKNEQQQTK